MRNVALLRGVNVGGKNLLPMKELAEIFVKARCTDVCTYIQSGNVIFSAPATLLKGLPKLITEQIQARYGYSVPVVMRTAQQIAQTIHDNPFIQAGKPEKTLHVYFLADLPDPVAVSKLNPNRSPTDTFCVRNREVYLHLPNGMGRTKLTNAYFDSKLATTSTGRNWATVLRLFEMMQA